MVKAERLARLEVEIRQVEAEAKSRAAEYKGRIGGLVNERSSLSLAIRDKAETRPVECREVLSQLSSEVILFRNDTNEEISRRPMTYKKRQRKPPASAEGMNLALCEVEELQF
jgi:hypothetical protein